MLEKLLSSALYVLVLLQGVVKMLRSKLRARRFDLLPDDIFVVSFPKSGTTLAQMILYQLTTDGDMDFDHVDQVSPFFETILWNGNPFLGSIRPPRIFKSHLPYQRLPRGARYVYIYRNVMSVAISAYHHYCLVCGFRHDLDQFVAQFVKGRTFCGSWQKHLTSWYPHRNDKNVLFLKYEDVVADLDKAVRRIAAFLELQLDDEKIARVCERCSHEFMAKHEEKFDPRLSQIGPPVKERFIRKGKVDGWREELSPAHREMLVESLQASADLMHLGLPENYSGTAALD